MRARISTLSVIAILVSILIIISSFLSYYVISLSTRYNELRSSLNKEVSDIKSSISSALEGVSSLLTKLNTTLSLLAKNVTSLRAETLKIHDIYREIQELKAKLKELNESLRERATLEDLRKLMVKVDRLESMLSNAATISDIDKIRSAIDEIREDVSKLSSLMEFPAEVIDASGEVVVIPSKPHRIVSLLPSVTEILFAIGADEQVVGVDEYSNYPPEVVKAVEEGRIVNIGSGWYPNIESILSLNPDLIIGVDSVVSHHTLKEIFSREGIPLILLPDKTLNDVITSIVIVGKATGHMDEAAKLAQELRSEISNLRSKVMEYLSTHRKPKVALVVWLNPVWVAGNNTWLNDLITLAGGINAFINVSGWVSINPEALIEASPDVIIVTHVGINSSDALKILKEFVGDAYKYIPALSQGEVYCIGGHYLDALIRPGPRVVQALKILIAIINPEVLGLKPEEVPKDINPGTFKIPS